MATIQAYRDPRVDPKVGDILRIRNKTFQVTGVGKCVEGKPRVSYHQVTLKDLSCELKRWRKFKATAEIVRRGEN